MPGAIVTDSGPEARPSYDAASEPPDVSMPSIPPSEEALVVFEPGTGNLAALALSAPELPRPPAAPRVRPGLDFAPHPGESLPIYPSRSSAIVVKAKSEAALAGLALLSGFGGGLLLAWLAGWI